MKKHLRSSPAPQNPQLSPGKCHCTTPFSARLSASTPPSTMPCCAKSSHQPASQLPKECTYLEAPTSQCTRDSCSGRTGWAKGRTGAPSNPSGTLTWQLVIAKRLTLRIHYLREMTQPKKKKPLLSLQRRARLVRCRFRTSSFLLDWGGMLGKFLKLFKSGFVYM